MLCSVFISKDKILKQYKNINVVISENDNMMFGAMKAMDHAGVKYGVKGEVITISFDALKESFNRNPFLLRKFQHILPAILDNRINNHIINFLGNQVVCRLYWIEYIRNIWIEKWF